MVAVQIDKTAPDVTALFRVHAIPDLAATQREGRPIYRDEEVCDIYIPGSKDFRTCLANDFADWNMEDAFGQRTERTYAERFNEAYLAFKKNDPQFLGGTPLTELPFLTEGKRLELRALHIMTAEQLAGLDGANLKMLGMNGRELKDKAQAYIETALKTNDTAAMHAELAKRDAQIAELQRKMEAMLNAGMTTKGEVRTADAVAQGAAPSALADGASSSNELDPATEAQLETNFSGFEDEDIKNWLTEAGVTVDGRWKNRARLLAEAKKVLDEKGRLQTA